MVTIPVEFSQKQETSTHDTEANRLEILGNEVLPRSLSAPPELLVGFVRDGRFRVRKPFTVRLEAENDDIIAEAREFNEFGFGKNPSGALADLQRAIVELYFTLEKEQGRLGPDLQNTWAALQEHFTKR